jgi:ABC-type phosphate transport system auxiliary subunit
LHLENKNSSHHLYISPPHQLLSSIPDKSNQQAAMAILTNDILVTVNQKDSAGKNFYGLTTVMETKEELRSAPQAELVNMRDSAGKEFYGFCTVM